MLNFYNSFYICNTIFLFCFKIFIIPQQVCNAHTTKYHTTHPLQQFPLIPLSIFYYSICDFTFSSYQWGFLLLLCSSSKLGSTTACPIWIPDRSGNITKCFRCKCIFPRKKLKQLQHLWYVCVLYACVYIRSSGTHTLLK